TFQNVSNSMAGTQALTASTSAAQQAMRSGNMIPATSLMAGSPTTAAALLTPTPAAQTVTVQVANTNLTVTVTVTRTMATVSQTATMPQAAMPTWNPVTFTQNAWQATHTLARGDLALVVGTRSHWTLHAQLVLFTPLSTAAVGGNAGGPVPDRVPAARLPAAGPGQRADQGRAAGARMGTRLYRPAPGGGDLRQLPAAQAPPARAAAHPHPPRRRLPAPRPGPGRTGPGRPGSGRARAG